MKQNGKSKFSDKPQKLSFTNDIINSIYSNGSLSYSEVLNKKGETLIYIWGKIPAGLSLKMNSQVAQSP